MVYLYMGSSTGVSLEAARLPGTICACIVTKENTNTDTNKNASNVYNGKAGKHQLINVSINMSAS